MAWQTKREEFSRVVAPADRDDDVLLVVQHVGHGRSALRGRHPYRARVRAGRLVVRPKHRASSECCRRVRGFAGDGHLGSTVRVFEVELDACR